MVAAAPMFFSLEKLLPVSYVKSGLPVSKRLSKGIRLLLGFPSTFTPASAGRGGTGDGTGLTFSRGWVQSTPSGAPTRQAL